MKLYRVLLVLMIFAAGMLIGGTLVLRALPAPVFSEFAAVPLAPTPTHLPDEIFLELDALDQVMINLYDRASPAVVHIISRSQSISPFFGAQNREGTGSGFFYDTEGHIVGIDIDHASQLVDLSRVETESLPLAKPRG